MPHRLAYSAAAAAAASISCHLRERKKSDGERERELVQTGHSKDLCVRVFGRKDGERERKCVCAVAWQSDVSPSLFPFLALTDHPCGN